MKHEAFHSPKARPQRINDPEGTIEVATAEFAGKGFSGARVDDIAARTKTSKRMIYYYFGGRKGCTSQCWKQHTGAFGVPRRHWTSNAGGPSKPYGPS